MPDKQMVRCPICGGVGKVGKPPFDGDSMPCPACQPVEAEPDTTNSVSTPNNIKVGGVLEPEPERICKCGHSIIRHYNPISGSVCCGEFTDRDCTCSGFDEATVNKNLTVEPVATPPAEPPKFGGLTRREFMALPSEERFKRLQESSIKFAQENPDYYGSVSDNDGCMSGESTCEPAVKREILPLVGGESPEGDTWCPCIPDAITSTQNWNCEDFKFANGEINCYECHQKAQRDADQLAYDALQAENEELKAKVYKTSHMYIWKLENSVDNLTKEMATLQARLEKAEEVINALHAAETTLTIRCNEAESQLSTTKEELRIGNHLYAELTDKFNDKDYEAKALKQLMLTKEDIEAIMKFRRSSLNPISKELQAKLSQQANTSRDKS